ncbi:MAG: 4Fe-4S dicluster domain-containing protein [Desulfocucumaceae bacterium]
MIQVESSSNAVLEINREWCKGCRLCAEACPKGLMSIDKLGKVKVERPEDCTGCGMCEATCPDFAIRVEKKVKKNA